MPLSFTHLPYKDTGFFSQLVTDYLDGADNIRPFYKYAPNAQGLGQAIKDRQQYPVDRQLLADVLEKQYASLPDTEAVRDNIALLRQEQTFTICTAHQPNLMTGYLYFIYKITHAIKLAEELNQLHPDKQFVPVYYMGSEDNDLDELGTFRYEGKKYTWDAGGQTGAVGRMNTKSLKPLLQDLFKVLGPPGSKLDVLKELIQHAYLEHDNIADATQYLVHCLFGKYGLIVLNPDEAAFKKSMLAILQDDLLSGTPEQITAATIQELSGHYKAQAHPRRVNLFYLKDNIRERIEKQDGKWIVVNTDIEWEEEALINELNAHPERFSPNVILRGLLQETILPDVAFIGGGAEVAYWLQLKDLFAHYSVFYPVVLVRQSALWIGEKAAQLRQKLNLSVTDIFKGEQQLIKDFIIANGSGNWQAEEEDAAITAVLNRLKEKATGLDPTLSASAEAAITRMRHQLTVLEKKMYRAEKRNADTHTARISKLKDMLFPNGSLQERYENFLPYFLMYGTNFISTLKEATHPLHAMFLVIEDGDGAK